jgi:hypothetical protein
MEQNDLDKSWSQVFEQTDWTRLWHAYGPAADTPGHLRALLDGSDDERRAAENHLISAVMHQGTPWSVTRVVIGLLQDDAVAQRIRPSLEGIFAYLDEVEDCLEQLSDDDWSEVERMAARVPDTFDAITEWTAVEKDEELMNAYFARAGLDLRRLLPRILSCRAIHGK